MALCFRDPWGWRPELYADIKIIVFRQKTISTYLPLQKLWKEKQLKFKSERWEMIKQMAEEENVLTDLYPGERLTKAGVQQ